MNHQSYTSQVVSAWESEYKKGLLTFWILLSLYDSPRHVREIKHFIEEEAATNLAVDEKSVYRSVGRLRKMELIEPKEIESQHGGPVLKVYILTDTGRAALAQFYHNNIASVFLSAEFAQRTKGL